VDAVNERYRLQAEYLDGLVGRFVQRLRDEGLYERSTILLTGDHGIRRQVVNKSDEIGDEGIPVDDDVTRVPFLVKAPGIAPAVLDVDYQHADFEATLRDVLGVSPIPTDGVSAFETDRPARQRLFYVDQDNDRYWKYVRSESTGEWDLVDYVIGPLPEELESLATTVN
jgi:arylsulfatase A-like enzyme